MAKISELPLGATGRPPRENQIDTFFPIVTLLEKKESCKNFDQIVEHMSNSQLLPSAK
jgi:hypothetical protein